MAQPIPASDLDLYSDEVLNDPYEYHRRLREAGPAVWLERHNAWVMTRYTAVHDALRDWKTFSSAEGVALNDTLAHRHDRRLATGQLWRPIPSTCRATRLAMWTSATAFTFARALA